MKINMDQMPKHELDRLANSFLRLAEKMFADPAIQKEFAEWQAARKKQEAAYGQN